MAHVSGNPAWKSWPSTDTPISALALEQLENALDAASGGTRPRVRGPYAPTAYSTLATGASGRTAGSVVVPDPGFAWTPYACGQLEARCGANSRAAVGIYRTGYAAANMCGHGAGLDPVNQGSGGNGWWMIGALPWFPAATGAPIIPAGAVAADRTFLIAPIVDYGQANVECTTLYAQLLIWCMPA